MCDDSDEEPTDPAADRSIPKIPACLQLRSVTRGLMAFGEALKLETYKQAAHVFLWAPQAGSSSFGTLRAAVMMQLRFDGTFGFPGGLVDRDEDIVTGLNRELSEEIGWDPKAHPVTMQDYYYTQALDHRKLVLHFFTKQLTLEQLSVLEKACPMCKDYGEEVMGSVRVPLYTMHNKYNGLPAFINNKFVGSAKQQLLLALHHVGLFTEDEVSEVILKSQNLKLSSRQF